MLIAATALVAAGALFFRDDTKRELSDFRLQSLIQDQAAALSQMRQLLADQRADARAARDQLAERIEQLQARLEGQQQRLAALATSDRSDWQLSEAEYFLQLANQRLLLGGDPKTALEQLQAADDIIRHIEDSGLLPTRAALAKDVAALKSLEVVDMEGLYLAIEAVAEQAQQLQLIAPVTMQEQAPEVLNADATLGERLQSGLRAALRKLDQLVQIRRRDEPYKPLLAPQYEAALQQNIKLAFEQAQVALLLSNQKLYEHSLSKAREALTTYYTIDEHATQIVAQAIDELANKKVAMKLPDISQSRRELKAYLNARRAEVSAKNDVPKVVP
jgi:uroporphyrin-3 C-methyltransferase